MEINLETQNCVKFLKNIVSKFTILGVQSLTALSPCENRESSERLTLPKEQTRIFLTILVRQLKADNPRPCTLLLKTVNEESHINCIYLKVKGELQLHKTQK